MALSAGDFGRPNPSAPPELARLGFLVGEWRGEARETGLDGVVRRYPVRRVGRYILDGWVIADEYRQLGPGGELVQLGETFRSFDPRRARYVMRWLNGLTSAWLELGPDDLGGIEVTAERIAFQHRPPDDLPAGLLPPDARFRNSFTDIRPERFLWRAELSLDGGLG